MYDTGDLRGVVCVVPSALEYWRFLQTAQCRVAEQSQHTTSSVGIAGRGLGTVYPTSRLQTLIFERKSVLNLNFFDFNPCAKFQTFRHLTIPVLLG